MIVNIVFGVIGGVLLLVAVIGGVLYERYRRSKGIKKSGPNLFERATKQFNDEFKRYDEKKAIKAKNKLEVKKLANKNHIPEIKLKNSLADPKAQAKKYQDIIDGPKITKKA